jgi:hypothetical protein
VDPGKDPATCVANRATARRAQKCRGETADELALLKPRLPDDQVRVNGTTRCGEQLLYRRRLVSDFWKECASIPETRSVCDVFVHHVFNLGRSQIGPRRFVTASTTCDSTCATVPVASMTVQ